VTDSLAHQPSQRNQVLERIARFIGHYKPERILRTAVDGVDGVGKTMFANELGSTVERIGRPVIRSSVDVFHNPREFRVPDRGSGRFHGHEPLSKTGEYELGGLGAGQRPRIYCSCSQLVMTRSAGAIKRLRPTALTS
jgi:hypothetical protein